MKVLLLCDFLGLWAMNVVVSIGRWSDGSFLSVVHVVLGAMCIGIIVRSGEVGCCRCRWVWIGCQVGWSSFMMVWFESFIMLLIVVPL